ncbi:MAG: EF-P lysine aminoacylase GenX [Gammaproteobacteria bacterium]|jgi:lysyl-tRNA synthetase class 2|nr:EF-P lysine aminoacylase GenX [Gammaproteobacteria bacterium]
MINDKRPIAENLWRPRASNKVLLARALMLKNIRAFFDARDVIEVETPLLSHYSTPDPHLDSLQSSFRGRVCYLNTSPEFAMKRLLAEHGHSIYQICKAFRDDELGPLHNPEFTMLEWYQIDYDMLQLMNEIADLVIKLSSLSTMSSGVHQPLKKPSFLHLSYQRAFENFAGINPHQTDANQCYQTARNNNIEIPQGMTPDDDVDAWLDWLLIQLVLPAFDKQGFTFLYDYPASQCALAKIENNDQQIAVAKRFELFFGEVELANGFNELTDVHEQLHRFGLDNESRRKAGKHEVCIDENFISALRSGLPDCSGVALGLDRLLMVLMSAAQIDEVLSFSWGNS